MLDGICKDAQQPLDTQNILYVCIARVDINSAILISSLGYVRFAAGQLTKLSTNRDLHLRQICTHIWVCNNSHLLYNLCICEFYPTYISFMKLQLYETGIDFIINAIMRLHHQLWRTNTRNIIVNILVEIQMQIKAIT